MRSGFGGKQGSLSGRSIGKKDLVDRAGSKHSLIRAIGGGDILTWIDATSTSNTLGSNLTNSTIINKYLLLPKQSQSRFQEYAKKEIESLGLIPKFLDVSFVYEDDGAVHCLLNVSRACKTAPQMKRRKKTN